MRPDESIEFAGELSEWDAKASYVLVTVPPEESEDIRLSGAMPAGFGSFKVEVTIGATTWQTSVFPASECFVLPVKQAVRRAESIDVGDVATVRLRVIGAADK